MSDDNLARAIIGHAEAVLVLAAALREQEAGLAARSAAREPRLAAAAERAAAKVPKVEKDDRWKGVKGQTAESWAALDPRNRKMLLDLASKA